MKNNWHSKSFFIVALIIFVSIECFGQKTDFGTVSDSTDYFITIRQLPEFTATAKRPIVRQKDGRIIFDVQNSFFKDAGRLLDVLKKIPGVSVDFQDNISMFGKGSPIIFINKKEVYSKEELTSLNANDIESIEIDNNPSSEYSTSGYAVIQIKTRKPASDFFSSFVSNDVYVGRQFSDRIYMNFSNKFNKISNFFTYSYTDVSFKQYDKATQTIIHPNDTLFSWKQAVLNARNNSHNLFYSMDYILNKKNSIGIQYSGNIGTSKYKKINDQTIGESNENLQYRQFDIDHHKNNYLHNISMNYTLTINNTNALFIVGDYAFAQNSQKDNIFEYDKSVNLPTKSIATYQDNYNVLATRAEFSSHLKYLNYKIGLKYSKINDNGSYDFNHNPYSNDLNDEIIASFISIDKSFGSYSIKAGLRGEYTIPNVKISEENKPVIDTAYYNLFPNFQIIKKFSDKTNLIFSYSKRINRASFNQLNPRFNYLDSLSYMVGNPLLKPALSNVFELKASFPNLSFSVGYKNTTNQIVYFAETDSKNSNRIKFTYNNISKAEYLLGNVTYTFTLPHISGFASLYVSKPYINYTFLEEKYKLRKPISQFKINFDYAVSNNISFNCSFLYQSAGETGLDYFQSFSDLSLAVKQSFLNKKLSLLVGVDDVLKTNKPNSWESKQGNIISTMDSDVDSRRILIKLSYNFGNLKANNTKKSANEEERNRL